MEYLIDNLVDKSEIDSFGHFEIAKEIGNIIKNEDFSSKSMTIGIFGKWGVGKSSILQLLRFEELPENENNLVYIDVPIWKYSDSKSIRRKFIYQIAKKLGQEDTIKNLYYDITTEGSLNFIKRIKTTFSELKKDIERLLGYFFSITIICFIIYAILKEITLNNFLLFYNSAISIAIVGFLIKLIQDIKFSKTTETQKVFESEEQFEHLVENSLQKINKKKIFIIDDLDRCDSSRILSVFEVIMNFISIKNCVFIIACDPDVIRKAIDKETNNHNHSSEINKQNSNDIPFSKNSGFYLEKIFQYTIDIPEFMPQNMRDYAKILIETANINIFKDNILHTKLDKIIFILIYKDTFNPRKVKTLLNKFILNYKLALKLEKNNKSFLSKGLITFFPERLAFFTVLRFEFPIILDKLKEAPSYNFVDWALSLNYDLEFREYLQQNIDLFSEDWNILPFIYFNNDPSILSLETSQIENINIINSSLRNGNIIRIQDLLRNEKEIEDFIIYAYHQLEILNNAVEKENAVRIILSVFKNINFNSINIPKNYNSDSEIIRQINNLVIKSKKFDNEGLISFLAFLFIHNLNGGKEILSIYLDNFIQSNYENLDVFFREKYFKIFNENAKDLLISKLDPSINTIENIIILLDNVKLTEENIEYFIKTFKIISNLYEKIISKKETEIKLENIETAYFNVLNSCLLLRNSDFKILFKSNTPLEIALEKFEERIDEYSDESIDIVLKGIIELCDYNEYYIIQDITLEFLIKVVQKRNVNSEFGSILDTEVSNELQNLELDIEDVNTIKSLLNLISVCGSKHSHEFNQTKITLQSIIDFENKIEISKIIFNWVKLNYNNAFDPAKIIQHNLEFVFNNPIDLKVNSANSSIISVYFDFVTFFLNKGKEKDIVIEAGSLLTITTKHTLYNSNITNFNISFISNLFDLMGLLQTNFKINFRSTYEYILLNYLNYSHDILELVISNLLKIVEFNNIPLVSGESKEVISYNKLIEDSKIPYKIRFKVFIYRFNISDSWWPSTDIKHLNKITLFHQDIPIKLKSRLLIDLENKFKKILDPQKWGKGKDWSKLTKEISDSIIRISKIHTFKYPELITCIINAIEYYVGKNGFVENIISLLQILDEDFIPIDSIPNKSKFSTNLKIVLTKYKKTRKLLGTRINEKFNLKIAKKFFNN